MAVQAFSACTIFIRILSNSWHIPSGICVNKTIKNEIIKETFLCNVCFGWEMEYMSVLFAFGDVIRAIVEGKDLPWCLVVLLCLWTLCAIVQHVIGKDSAGKENNMALKEQDESKN